MSEYASPFVKNFVSRTNAVIQNYVGELDATVLINCLLGMLVVPFETSGEKLAEEQIEFRIGEILNKVKSDGRYIDYGKRNSAYTLIRHLRNSIAHFHIDPIHENGEVWGFSFTGYAANKICEMTGDICSFKNEINSRSSKVFLIKLSIDEIKRLSSIICESIIDL